MKQEVWIAGMGAISAIGQTVDANLQALCEGISGTSFPEYLETVHHKNWPVCEIKSSNAELARLSDMPEHLPRTAYLSAIAASEAINSIVNFAGNSIGSAIISEKQWRCGFISGNTVGGMDRTEYFYPEFLKDPQHGHLRDVKNHECGTITELVREQLKIQGYSTTISTACSSSANTILHAARLIRHNKLDMVIAGGADALCRFTLNGFNTLMILDTKPSTPFDENRNGLNLGEAGAYLILISDRLKNELNLQTVARLSGYANANDAYHQTASSAEGNGNYKAMSEAIQSSGIALNEIDYINAHGTGTSNNDSSEGIAIQRIFGDTIPLVSSTKANTGHTLGACGALEAVYACLSLHHQIIFPNLRFQNQMHELKFSPNTILRRDVPVRHVLSNSFGFGGNCTSLLFSQP